MKAEPPEGGNRTKLRPAWRALRDGPTGRKLEAALPKSVQRLSVASTNCRRKRMNIVSCARPSPGIEPRIPTVSCWSGGLHTSIVAHRSGEVRSELGTCAGVARGVRALDAGAVTAAAAAVKAMTITAAARSAASPRPTLAMRLTIAPARDAGGSRLGGGGTRAFACDIPAAVASTSSQEVVELLGRGPVFSTLERADLERIAQLARPRRVAPGEVVFREGDASDTCYIVREGRAIAVRTHRGGRTITLARFGPGDIFGELALFEDERRSATVEALEPTSVVGVLGPDMRRLLNEHAEMSARLVIALGRRLRETNERLARQSFQTVQSRVAVVLSQLVDQEQAAGAAGDVLVTATQSDLAQLAGSSRESASRFLAVLERAGVISQGRGRLVVHDPEALKQYVF